jgi:hypothetical protein
MRIFLEANGETIIDKDFVAPSFEIAEPVPASITRRQCAIELFDRQMITGPEMVAMVASSQPPAMVSAIFDQLPGSDRWIALTNFAAETYERANPLLNRIMKADGANDAAIDDFFRAAGQR